MPQKEIRIVCKNVFKDGGTPSKERFTKLRAELIRRREQTRPAKP